MCLGDCKFCIVPQSTLFTNRDCFSWNSLLASLFVCSPFSKSRDCRGICGWLFFLITLPFRIALGVFLFGIGLFIDAIFTALFLITFCWCCGKCHKWGCKYCCRTKDRPAHDCILVICVFEECC